VVRSERVVLVVRYFGGGYICRISKHLLWLVLDFNSGADSRSGGVDAIKFVKESLFWDNLWLGFAVMRASTFLWQVLRQVLLLLVQSNVGDITERSKLVVLELSKGSDSLEDKVVFHLVIGE